MLEEILKWPVIVQGALGSALFWLIAVSGEKMARRFGAAVGKFSHKRQLGRLRAERLRYMALEENTDNSFANLAITSLVYVALHSLTRGLVMLVLGLVFGTVVPVLGIVGYLMAAYYFLEASNAVRDIEDVEPSKKVVEIDEIIAKIEAET